MGRNLYGPLKPSAPVEVRDEGGSLTKDTVSVNFAGAGVMATSDTDGNITVTIDGGGGGGGSTYPEVNTYADLPSASGNSGAIYVIRTSTGVWLINRKEAGLWRSDGSNWNRLGNWPDAFNDANFKIYNNTDPSRQAAFNTASIATGTTRTVTVPNKDGTMAMLDDLPAGSGFPPQLGYGGFF